LSEPFLFLKNKVVVHNEHLVSDLMSLLRAIIDRYMKFCIEMDQSYAFCAYVYMNYCLFVRNYKHANSEK
jgi:hypothetical protein